MKSKDFPFIKRREFLISAASLAGVGLPAICQAASKPCPPAALSVTGGSATTASCGSSPGALPVLTLTSAGPSGTYPWTFGQAFRQGDVPGGTYLASNANSFQAEVRNRWSDGSAKFAVLSGVSSFTQGQPRVVELSVTATAPAGAVVPEPTSLDASVTFSGGLTGAVTLQSVLGLDKSSWSNKTTGGRVRTIPGPVMSEFHYYVPTSDPHVAVWFFVRRYVTGTTEIETVVENGWLKVASPGQKDYSVSLSVGGSTRYSGTISQLHHTRWSRVDWVGVDPAILPRHDGAYLRATKLVPNFTTAYGLPSEATLNALSQPTAPFAQGAWTDPMGAAGGGGRILNNWDALYVTSGDARAYRSLIAHSQSAGRYGIYYRDETTGSPPLYASHSTFGYTGSGISDCGSAAATFPTGGAAPPNYAKSHATPFGYLPYLTTGRHSFREQVEFQAHVSYFAANSTSIYEAMRIPTPNAGAFTLRGWGWTLRSFAAAVVCVPDSDARAAQYRAQLGKTLAWANDNFAGKNNLGLVIGYTNYASDGTTATGFWQEDSVTMAVGFAQQVALDSLAGADKSRAQNFCLWRMGAVVGRFGNQSGHCYRYAVGYDEKISDASSAYTGGIDNFNAVLYPDWATVYSKNYGANSCDTSTVLQGSSGSAPADLSTVPYPYWGLAHAALAYAVDLGYPGAAQAWARYVAAANYAPSNFNNLPLWGIVPR